MNLECCRVARISQPQLSFLVYIYDCLCCIANHDETAFSSEFGKMFEVAKIAFGTKLGSECFNGLLGRRPTVVTAGPAKLRTKHRVKV